MFHERKQFMSTIKVIKQSVVHYQFLTIFEFFKIIAIFNFLAKIRRWRFMSKLTAHIVDPLA